MIDSYISHHEFVSVNTVLREYYEMKKEIRIPKTYVEYDKQKQWKPIVSDATKNILLTKIQVSKELSKID